MYAFVILSKRIKIKTRLDTTLDTVTSQRVLKPRLNPAALLYRAMLRPLVSHFKPVEGPGKKSISFSRKLKPCIIAGGCKQRAKYTAHTRSFEN